MRTSLIFIVLISVFCGISASAQDELKVVQGDNQWLQFTDARNALYHHFADEAFQHLDKRRKELNRIESPDGWKERQNWTRQTLLRILGPFPEKTPLNARTVKSIDKEGYRIEHIIYESQPKFFVTASLFIPSSLKRRDKAPAVIYCSGHSAEGYRSKAYQHVILNLVKDRLGDTIHIHELDTVPYPWQDLFDELVKMDYAGWTLWECSSSPADPVAALMQQRRIWADMLAKAEK